MLDQITNDLIAELAGLTFGAPVTHVYNPLVYARRPWDIYCRKYGAAPKEILLYGMNPGPFGMGQVGVPFGEVGMVRDWLGIQAKVAKPKVEHPKRPVLGFECTRSEVSGKRFWRWAKEKFGNPDSFFKRFFISNYCPLAFMEESGRNRTPDKLPKTEREPLFAACDRALLRTIKQLQPRYVLGVGVFAEMRLKAALLDMNITIGRVPHPSPANPAANRGWALLMDRALEEAGIVL